MGKENIGKRKGKVKNLKSKYNSSRDQTPQCGPTP
jgi:hypothetical protein